MGDTLARAARLPEAALQERVDGEWSFVETLRHLVFATDAWYGRAILGQHGHFYRAGMPFDELSDDDAEACGVNKRAKPTLEKVMVARKDRQRAVRKLIAGLTPAELDRHCVPNPARGFPANPERFTVRQCLGVIVNEEWLHRSFANRDLAVLAAQ